MEREKEAGIAELISNKTDFKTKSIIRDKETQCILIKGTVQQEDITLINIYTPKIGAPKYVKQILMDIKGDIDINTVFIGNFNNPLTLMYRYSRQKINRKTVKFIFIIYIIYLCLQYIYE